MLHEIECHLVFGNALIQCYSHVKTTHGREVGALLHASLHGQGILERGTDVLQKKPSDERVECEKGSPCCGVGNSEHLKICETSQGFCNE